MKNETLEQRSRRILNQLKTKYPNKNAFDLDGKGMHFVSEIEPTSNHPEYDKAIEVIIKSRPHKHLKMIQHYTILSGTLKLYLDDKVIILQPKDEYTINPNTIHWATSEKECWVEIYSKPGWSKEDHISMN
ncbi:hypothetical protein HN903_03500 [archaeon]|jgi:mannose-6-phosphate isomerase-like protein (cupin superfamily)|nr:hypothetical protein [archaeon]MBT7128795.1 hypothetical protein [archaeon]